jgi:hypothetical protein
VSKAHLARTGGGRLRPAPSGLLSVLAAAVAVATAGCNGTPEAAAPTPGPCAGRRAPIGPDVTTSLRNDDNGVTLCLTKGESVSVFLNAPPDGPGWAAITPTRSKVLTTRATNQITLARGVTAAIFVAAKPGATRLTSLRDPCTGPDAGCDPDHAWTAVVVVSR